jgi:hypothetical protein
MLYIFIEADNTAPSLCIFNAITVQLRATAEYVRKDGRQLARMAVAPAV